MTGQIKDVVVKGDTLYAALYLGDHSTEKAYMVAAEADLSEPMWLSKKWCKILRRANDGVRYVFEIPMHQAKYHKKLVGEEKWIKSKR